MRGRAKSREKKQLESKKKQKKQKEEKKEEKRQEFFQETQKLFFCSFSLSKRKKTTQRRHNKEDETCKESLLKRCLTARIARRRIEWKRNPSMKRSPRSPCWYELNIFIYVLCSYDWEERRIRQPFFCFFVYFFFFGVMMMFCV